MQGPGWSRQAEKAVALSHLSAWLDPQLVAGIAMGLLCPLEARFPALSEALGALVSSAKAREKWGFCTVDVGSRSPQDCWRQTGGYLGPRTLKAQAIAALCVPCVCVVNTICLQD